MTDIHIDGQNEEVEFEREDLGAKPIIVFLVALIVGCVLVALLLKGMYSYLDKRPRLSTSLYRVRWRSRPRRTRGRLSPVTLQSFLSPGWKPTRPSEINAFRLQEAQTLHSYGWVDQQAGVVRIPIDRAMELLAQRGLPTRPQAGVAPPSDVNTAKEAARRSDTSAKPAKKK